MGEAARLYAEDYREGKSGAVAAEAALRHGRLLERLGRTGAAQGAYLHAIELARDPMRRAAARLAWAHGFRRAGEWHEASGAYFEVVLDPLSPLSAVSQAWEWRGRCQLALGDLEAAQASFSAWSVAARSFSERIRAIDARAATVHRLGHHAQASRLMIHLLREARPLMDPQKDMGINLFRKISRLETLALSRECVWRSVHLRHNERDREGVGVAQRQPHGANAVLPCSFCRDTVEEQLRGGLAVADDLEIAKPDASGPARAQDLHSGLLGSHARGEMHRRILPALAFLLFGRGEHAVQQGLAPALQAGFEPSDIDQVHPDSGQSFRQMHDHRGGA